MRTETIEMNGAPTDVRLAGESGAEMILLLHGFPEFGLAWAELMPHLADLALCVAPDQRAHGRSYTPADVRDYAVGPLVGDALAFLDRYADGRRVTVLGHDWGAAVAYALAAFYPERVARLVILNGVHPIPFQRALAAGGPQTAASQYIPWLRAEGVEDVLAADNFAKLEALFAANMDMSWLTGATREAYLAAWSRPGALTGMLNWYRASPLAVAKPGEPLADPPVLPAERLRIPMPHLVIWGVNDTALLPESREGLADLCDDLRMVEIAGADHWLHHQKPSEVAGHIRRFIEDTP
ncbi:MAG: alpha/beta hydrolase [Pseudomonadota bacterium]